MDDFELARHFLEKSKEWIIQKSILNRQIEDDEILDLDSLSLGSDDDTWLYSSETKIFRNSDEKVFITGDDSIVSSPITSSNFIDEEFASKNEYSYGNFSSMSPLIDVNNCSDSLIHVPDVSAAAVDNFFILTPVEEKKSKLYSRTAVSNYSQCHRADIVGSKDETESSTINKTDFNAFQKHEEIPSLPNHDNSFTKKLLANVNDGVDKNYVLHSVENKLFTITDTEKNDVSNFHHKIHENRENMPHDFGKNKKENPVTKEDTVSNVSSNKTTDFHNKTSKIASKISFSNVHENDENEQRLPSKKHAPVCQSTPMLLKPRLLNRYLKYNKCIDDSKNYSEWRTSSEFLQQGFYKNHDDIANNEMNVSYVKQGSDNTSDSSSVKDFVSPLQQDCIDIDTNLNTTYSKSECLLNSTYNVQEEDDRSSSTSESSSVSSLNNKQSFSIRDVQKMAQLQEQSLQSKAQQPFAESSKSSEFSSSNESISPFSPLSSSNEGQIDAKSVSNVSREFHVRSAYVNRRPRTATDSLFYSAQMANISKSAILKYSSATQKKLPMNYVGVDVDMTYDKSIDVSPDPIPPPRNKQKLQKLCKNDINIKNRIAGSNSNTMKSLSTKIDSQLANEIKFDAKNTTFTSKESTTLKIAEKNHSVPLKDSLTTTLCSDRSASPGPVSHIPRPSSRIPMLRTSTSCTRYSKSSFSSSKK